MQGTGAAHNSAVKMHCMAGAVAHNSLGSEEALKELCQSTGESHPQVSGGSAQLQLQSTGQNEYWQLQGTAQLEVSHSKDESKSRVPLAQLEHFQVEWLSLCTQSESCASLCAISVVMVLAANQSN